VHNGSINKSINHYQTIGILYAIDRLSVCLSVDAFSDIVPKRLMYHATFFTAQWRHNWS